MQIANHLTGLRPAVIAACGMAIATSSCTALKQAEQAGTKPVPIGEALQQLQLDLSRVKIAVPSTLLLADPRKNLVDTDEGGAILVVIADSQCFDINPVDGNPKVSLRHRDPLIPVSTGPIQITVQGQLAEAGTFTLSVTPSAGGTVTRQAQQQVMAPITLVSLETLPAFYVGQQTANIQYVTLVDAYKPADSDKANAQHQQIADYISSDLVVASRLTTLTQYALKQFDTNQERWCSGKDKGGVTLIGPSEPKAPSTH